MLGRRPLWSPLVIIVLTVILLLTQTTTGWAAPPLRPPLRLQGEETATDGPRTCINALKATHLSMSALSIGLGFSPLKAWGTAADLAAHVAEVGLKHCVPDLKAPPDKLIIPPSGTCAISMRIPINRDALAQIVLDSQILELVLADPGITLPPGFEQELRAALESPYGQFTNETTGEYSNVYAIVLPGISTAIYASHWGDVGVPEIYHYQSDVQVTLRHPGERIDANTVRFRPGVHTLTWTGDTLISGADLVWIPDLSNLGPAEDKAKKKTAKETWKQTIKRWIRQAKDAAKDVYTDIAKNQAKKTKAKLVKAGKKQVAKKAVKSSVGYVLDEYFLSSYTHGYTTVDYQRIIIIDHNAPTISGNEPVTVEALEPGGVSSRNHLSMLRDQITVSDDCDLDPDLFSSTSAFWPLSLQEDGSSVPSAITWTAQDNGAVDVNGGRNEEQVTQQVTVVDTKPPILVAPPPVIMEATGSAIDVPLGMAQVFDVADLRPTITNDAPAEFMQGIYHINWSATDFSGNVSAATKDTVQIVNIKEPGTNKLPTAFSQTGANAIQAIADEPVKITVRGQDGDTVPDPLWFSIENQPENGFFIAPLYPYFIDDYRMTARYSPQIATDRGEEFAWELAADPNKMRDYIKEICAEDIQRRDLPRDFVSWRGGSEKYMAVDDDGFTYIADSYYDRCSPGGSTISPTTQERISVWDPSGLYVGGIDQSNSGPPLRDINFDLVRNRILQITSHGDSTGDGNLTILRINKENPDAPTLEVENSYRMNAHIEVPGSSRDVQFRNADSAAIDSNGVVYVGAWHNYRGLIAAYPRADDPDVLDFIAPLVFSISVDQSIGDESGIRLQNVHDIAVDSQNYLYAAATHYEKLDDNSVVLSDRIYKWAPATVHPDGTVELGELIGWLGKCHSGPNCDYINERSIGYSCTDDTCFITQGESGKGEGQGQFSGIGSIVIDPNDILYATDGRVQRFSPEGYIAGEASSTGDGSSFILGDFGFAGYIAVSKGSLYILDRDKEVVHVFDAAVIHGIDESSAWVEYQSAANYVGPDSFTFAATDGFRTVNQFSGETELLKSAPVTVEINVSRNHRPPIATAGLTISTTEDTPIALMLEGQDLDNFGVERDQLTFAVTTAPEGTLNGAGANLTYTPRTDFHGEDSFFFTVSDGRFTSEAEEFRIGITPVNDPPTVEAPADLTTGIGFPLTLEATILDPEREDTHSVTVDWGDGTMQSDGQILDDGSLSGPVLVASDGITRTLLAYHTYNTSGSYQVKITVTDSTGATGRATVNVTIDAMADLTIERNGATVVATNRANLAYDLVVTNRTPSGGSGITATGVTLNESIGNGLSYRLAAPDNGTCTPTGTQLTCSLDALAPGASTKVRIVVDADPALAVGEEIATLAEVTLNEADPIPDNNVIGARVTMLPVADFLVDSFEEGTDANPGDGFCTTNDGICTIRAAVQEANALPGKQVIALTRSLHMLNFEAETILAALVGSTTTPAEDGAVTGDLDITDDLELVGLSADESVIHANGGDRVIDVHSGATVTLRNLGLTGGAAIDNLEGGGLRNNGGTVLLDRVAVSNNVAGNGGGIANSSGSLRIIASSITGNSTTAGGSGGGISNEAELVLENVTISGNHADAGGGILAQGGNATLTNVTLYSNSATNAGGGINSDGTSLTMSNTILAGNQAATGPNCGFAIRSTGHNLLGDLTDCSVLGETVSNVIVEDAAMDILSANEADTFSHLPLDTSAAIDAGDCAVATDQRGVERPVGTACDIGALEYGGLVVVGMLYLPIVAR